MILKTALTFATALRVLGGQFIDLDLNAPTIRSGLPQVFAGGAMIGQVADIMPGWSISAGGTNLSVMRVVPLGLQSSGLAPELIQYPSIQAGVGYFLDLANTVTGPGGRPEYRLWQTGTIPVGTPILNFVANGFIDLYVDGSQVSLISGAHQHSVDLSGYAGRDVKVEFVVPAGNATTMDVSGFSAVPEPQTYALFGLGVFTIGVARILSSRRGPGKC